MASFGEHLKQIRELKGLSVEDVSRHSKINPHFIEALEAENFDTLPGGVFNRGFIKAYAKCCGADERELLSDYENLLKQKKGFDLQLLPVDKPAPSEGSRSTGRYVPAAIALVIIGVVGAFFYLRSTRMKVPQRTEAENASVQAPPIATHNEPSSQAPLSENPAVPAVLPPNPSAEQNSGSGTSPEGISTSNSPGPSKSDATPQSPQSQSFSAVEERKQPSTPPREAQVGSSDSQPAEDVVVSRGKGPIRIQIAAKENAWLSIRRDGTEIYRKIMLSKETLQFTAKEKLEIVCGNAGGVIFTVDGKTLPPLGRSGEVKSVTYARPAHP
jgi:cytoskeleton protein RodZ